MEFSLLGAVLVAVVSVWLVLRFEAGRTNAADCTRDLWDRILMAGIVGLAAGRIGAMLIDGVNPITNPGDLVIVRAGVDTTVASLAAVGTFAWSARKDLWWTADAAAPAIVAGLGGWHAGCIVRESACLGTASDLPWALSQAGSSVTRHPVEIYAALLLFSVAALLIVWKRYARPSSGVLAGVGLVAVGAVRLATEPLRPVIGSGPIPIYLAAIVVGAVVIVARRFGASSTARSDE